ncbi:MAG TPA: MBG domain-containing protein, partial [Nocardioides sp.]
MADESGAIGDSFNLPDWFVATYKVVATGEVSGVATTGFTDGNVAWSTDPAGAANVTATAYDDAGCTGKAKAPVTNSGDQLGVGNGSLLLAAPTSSGSRSFIKWDVTSTNVYSVRGDGTAVCIDAPTGSATAVARYTAGAAATTLTVPAATGTYGGSTTLTATLRTTSGSTPVAGRTVAFSLGGASVGTATTNASGVATVTGVSLGTTGAGSYPGRVSAAFAGDATYAVTSATADLTVAKAPLTVTADNKSKTYGDPTPVLTYSVSGLVNNDTRSTAFTKEPNLTTAAANIGAGAYAITASGGTSANYALSYAAGTLTVTKAVLDLTAENKGRAYGADNPALTYTVSGLVNGDSQATALPTGPALGTTATPSSPVGTYPIALTGGTPSNNYTLARHDGTLTVAERAITVTADSQSKVYGNDDPELTYRITQGALANGDRLTGSLTRDPGQDAGTYAIGRGSLSAGDNYAITFEPASFRINKRAITVTAEAKSKVYGDDDPALTYKISQGTLVGDDTLAGALDRADGRDVGTYAIGRGDLTAGTNYDLTYVGADFTITARPITVTAAPQTKVYGNADPDLTYALTTGRLVHGDVLTGALDRDAGQSVGTYAIRRGDLTAGTNYALTYVGADLSITARPITVTADAQSKVYGEVDPKLTYTISQGTLVEGDTLRGALARAEGERVGTYAIRVGSLSVGDNYALTFVPADLTIAKAALKVTADNATKVYGDENPVLTGTVTGLKEGDAVTATYTTEATQGSPAGDYAIVADVTGADAENYAVTLVDGNLRVTKALLTAKVVHSSKVYGSGNPGFAVSYDGFVLGEKADVLGGALTFTTSADEASVVGAYDVTASGLTSRNYAIDYLKGTLEVTPAELVVTVNDSAKVYGSGNPEFSVSYDGFVLDQDEGVLGGALEYETDATAASVVGHYDVTASGLTSHNYAISYVPGTLSVSKAPLVITAADKEKVYGDANPPLTGSVSGIQNRDVIEGGYSTVADEASGVGSYAIVARALGDEEVLANYDVTLVAGTLTVTHASLTVTVDDSAKVYGSANPAFSVSYKGFVLGQDKGVLGGSLAFTTDATAARNVAKYDVTASGLTSENYAISYTKGTLTVTKAPLSVMVDDSSKVYGDDNPSFSVSYGGFVLGQKRDVLGGALAFATDATAASNAGKYDVSASGLTSSNYAISYTKGTLEVTPAALSVKVVDSSKVYGSGNPAFSVSYKGFVLDQDKGVLDGSLTFTTDATAASNAGTYDVTASGLTSRNYTISYTKGTLTVAKAPLTVKVVDSSKVYGDDNPEF